MLTVWLQLLFHLQQAAEAVLTKERMHTQNTFPQRIHSKNLSQLCVAQMQKNLLLVKIILIARARQPQWECTECARFKILPKQLDVDKLFRGSLRTLGKALAMGIPLWPLQMCALYSFMILDLTQRLNLSTRLPLICQHLSLRTFTSSIRSTNPSLK